MAGLCEGRVAIVTGGARGIGREHALMLAEHGAKIVVNDLGGEMDGTGQSTGPAQEVVEEIKAMGGEAVSNGDSVADWEGAQRLINTAIESFGRLDVLINNASSFFPTVVGEISEREWDDLMGTNLKTPLFLSQAAAPHLRRSHGCIVNIIDIHGDRPMRNYVVYSVAKGGLLALARSLAAELGPEVRVNGVSPGAIIWPEDERWSDELARQRIVQTTLLKRIGDPEDIARTVGFLVFDAPYITGQVIAVDGGRSIHL
jgi:pteridine reductase